MSHNLDLIAPSLGEYRVALLTAIHEMNMVYPALVRSKVFDPASARPISVPVRTGLEVNSPSILRQAMRDFMPGAYIPDPEYRAAESQETFIQLVKEVLQSAWVRSLIESLIARSNAKPATTNGHPDEAGTQESQPRETKE